MSDTKAVADSWDDAEAGLVKVEDRAAEQFDDARELMALARAAGLPPCGIEDWTIDSACVLMWPVAGGHLYVWPRGGGRFDHRDVRESGVSRRLVAGQVVAWLKAKLGQEGKADGQA